MEVLEDRLVIVPNGQLGLGINQEQVIHSKVLEIVDYACKDKRRDIQFV